MSEPAYAQRHEVDPRIFSRVYSHISQHRGTADTGILLDLISAISLDRSASYFEVLERLEPSTRDLGLELLKAKLHGAFPPEAWEDAHQFARELNQRKPKREARHSAGSLTIVSKSAATRTPDPVTATAAKSADFESRSGRGLEQRARRPFRQRTRTALAYISQYGGFDGFKYLWGAAAAATVIGLFVLVVAFDERVFDRRFEELASWLSEPVESPPQIQEPMIAGVDTTQLAAPAPEETREGASDVLSEQSVLAEEPRPIADEPTAVEDDKMAITPPPASATESAPPESLLPPRDVPLSAPPQEPTVDAAPAGIASAEEPKIAIAPPLASASESGVPPDSSLAQDVPIAEQPQAPAADEPVPPVIASEPPKPVRGAVSKKAKSDSKVRSKPAKSSRAKSPVASPNPPTVERVEPVASQPQPKTPETALAEPVLENSRPPTAAVESANEAASSVENPRVVAAPERLEATRGAPQPREKVVANPSFVERLMGFKPGERIARIKPGRRATQPDFIRQLENVDGPTEGAGGGADVETN
ncbi:MAG: hypothetical protein ACREV9_10240 [Burkholderiales bacterium]